MERGGGKLSKSRSAGYIRRASAGIDVEPFSVANFSPFEYLKANMSVDTDEAIQNIHRTLQFAHEGTVFELGKSFYRNHVEFVAVAKEAERFESDLTAMRAIVSQLKTFGVQITGERQATTEATQPPSAKPATISLLVTNSPVVPEAPQVDVKEEVRAKLKKIAEVLPEASEFVASTTDILLESNELAVYIDKQWKPAQVWALSNGCLISSRKAKVSINSGVKQKMSFERFIPFDKCSISDVKDTPDLQNCFKLKGLAGSVFLHTPDSITKISWYSTIEARLNDLQSVKEQRPQINLAETVGKQVKAVIHRRTGSISTSGAASKPSLEGTFLDQQPELTPERIFVLQANLNDLADLIYRTQYDIAVDQLDRLNQELLSIPFNSPNINALRVQLQELRGTLVSYLLNELDDLLISKNNMASHVQRLIVLGCTEEAREQFLKNRSDLIKSKTKRIHFYGDVFTSTALLSAITFDSIEAAFDWYNFSFRDPKLVAGFVAWARAEISRFCDLFARQAFRPDLNTEVVASCVVDALENCRRLGYRGLDLSIFLQERLAASVTSALESRAAVHYARVNAAIELDDFQTCLPVDTPDWPAAFFPLSGHKITSSLTVLAAVALSLFGEVKPLVQSKLVSCCSDTLVRFIDTFSDSLIASFKNSDSRSKTALVNLVGNVCAIAELIIPGLIEKFPEKEAGRLEGLRARLHATAEALFDALSETIGKQLISKDFAQYCDGNEELSQWVKEAIPALSKLARDAPSDRRQQLVDGAVLKMVQVFELGFEQDLIKFSAAGLRRFVIDWKLIQKITQQIPITPDTTSSIEGIIKEAKNRLSGGDLDAPLPYGQAIDEELLRLEGTFTAFALDFGSGK